MRTNNGKKIALIILGLFWPPRLILLLIIPVEQFHQKMTRCYTKDNKPDVIMLDAGLLIPMAACFQILSSVIITSSTTDVDVITNLSLAATG